MKRMKGKCDHDMIKMRSVILNDISFYYSIVCVISHGGYHPDRSTTTPSVLRDWLNSLLVEDLVCVPGIGKKNKCLLEESNDHGCVCSTYELFGKFLSLKGPGVDSVTHCDRFFHWLHAKGITSHTASIVQAVAERTNIMIPNIYDGNFITFKCLFLVTLLLQPLRMSQSG